MFLDATILTIFSLIKLTVAVILFSQPLPKRGHLGLRILGTSLVLCSLVAASVVFGFSVFPALTDDLSFAFAILTFVGVLAVSVLMQRVIFSCSPWTSIYCCSMAYLLENLSSAVERSVSLIAPISSYPPPLLDASVSYWVVSALVYAIAYVSVIRHIRSNGLLLISDPVMVISAALVIVVNMMLDLIVKDLAMFDIPARYPSALSVIYILLCVFIMYAIFEIVYVRRLRLNMAAVEQMRVAEARQYEMSRQTIEAVNLKFHDIKHQIGLLSARRVSEDVIEEINREIAKYDSSVRCGNDALDTILTEKQLICQRRGITLSCIVDGRSLGFMPPTDLYSLFGNALDNAIEATMSISDPNRRSISLVVCRKGDMALMHLENYFEGSVTLNEEGLPITRKADRLSHGFGMKSMRLIVEGHGGTLSVLARDGVFHLNALIPLPTEATEGKGRG